MQKTTNERCFSRRCLQWLHKLWQHGFGPLRTCAQAFKCNIEVSYVASACRLLGMQKHIQARPSQHTLQAIFSARKLCNGSRPNCNMPCATESRARRRAKETEVVTWARLLFCLLPLACYVLPLSLPSVSAPTIASRATKQLKLQQS